MKSRQQDIGFKWWIIWAWLGMTVGNVFLFSQGKVIGEVAYFLILLNSVLMILVLRYNRYAFLAATIFSLNPVLWIINGVYLWKRWDHPRFSLTSSDSNDSTTAPVKEGFAGPKYFSESARIEDIQLTSRRDENKALVIATNAIKPSIKSTGSDEALWAHALAEFEGQDRRPGLWAKLFSESGGNESAAKASYLAYRVAEQKNELQ